MKIFEQVRGTMKNVPSVEVNIDTVYIRSNIVKVEEEDFIGWQYDEIQYPKDKYLEKLSNQDDIGAMATILSLVLAELDMLKSQIGGIK